MSSTRRSARRLLLLSLAGVLLFSLNPGLGARAQSDSFFMEAQAAYQGYFKYGEWLPVWVQLENRGADLQAELRVRVANDLGGNTYAVPAPLPAGARKRIPVYVMPNSFSQVLQVELVSGEQTLQRTTLNIFPTINLTYLVGVIAGGERTTFSLINGVKLQGAQERPKAVVDVALEDLPEIPEALRSFDCLILNDIDTALLTPGQAAALGAWVRSGGRLVIGGGAGAAKTVSGLPQDLSPLLPQALQEVADLPGLERFSGGEAVRVPGPFAAAAGELRQGRPLAEQAGLPLIVEAAAGGGWVDFIALDLAGSPFDAWAGATAFWEALLSPGSAYPAWLAPDMPARQMLTDQIGYALTNLPVLDLPSIRSLAILLGVYILLVGPVNYLALRWRKQMQLAWLTIPLITLLFSAGAYGLAYAMRGSDLILNRIAVIEAGPGSPARLVSYLGLFSPTRQAYEIDVATGGLVSPMRQQFDPWGTGQAAASGELVFVQGQTNQVRGLIVNQWSMQSVVVESTWPELGQVTSELALVGNSLQGEVRNQTAYPLRGAAIVFGSSITRLGDLPAGEATPVAIDLPETLSRRFMASVGWQMYEEQFTTATTPQRDLDIRRTVIDAVFTPESGKFRSVGGAGAASLSYQPVLLAWLDRAPPEVSVQGRTIGQQTTALLYAPLSYRLAGEGTVSLPLGMVPGSLVQLPADGGACGAEGISLWINRGEAVFEYRLPPSAQGVSIDALQLMVQTDGGWSQLPNTALYRWADQEWAPLDGAAIGVVQEIAPAQEYISPDGVIRLRLSAEFNAGGCLYIDMGARGRLP